MKIGILISHDLHRRNWIGAGMVRMLTERGHTVTIISPSPPTWNRVRRSLRLMTMVNEEPRSRTYRHKTTLLHGTRKLQAAVWRKLRDRGVDLATAAMRIEARLPIRAHRARLLAEMRPDLIIWPTLLHMDSVENDIIKATKRLGIPVLGAPASWDNLTTKGLWLVRPDRLMVWGEASKRHAVEIHGFAPEHVSAPGPAHFYFYEGGVTPPGRNVYVNGTSIHYWRDEDLMVEQMRAALPKATIVHSRHPRRRGQYVELDYIKRQIDNAACLIAAFSTTVIEAALCGRPSLLIGFGAGAQSETSAATGHQASAAVLDHLNYEHMADVAQWDGVYTVHSLPTLCAMVNALLDAREPWHSPNGLRAAALTVANAEPGIRERIIEAMEAAR